MRAWLKRCAGEMHLRLPRRQAVDPLFYACAFMAAASLVLGGGARSGRLRDVILTLLAIPLLAWGVWRLFDTDITRQMRWALWFCLALAGLPLLQLVPLPGWLWTLLPHREISAESFALIQQDVPWMPISVSPEATWLSALSLLPPLSLFVGTLLLGYRERRWLSLVIIAVGLISAFLGLLQVAQGPTSPLRLFRIYQSDRSRGVLCEPKPFRGPRLRACSPRRQLGRSTREPPPDQPSVESSLIPHRPSRRLAASRSSLCCWQPRPWRVRAPASASRWLRCSERSHWVSLTAEPRVNNPRRVDCSSVRSPLPCVLTVQFALYRILERFDVDPVQDARLTFLPNTIQAAKAYMPVGSGLGSFIPVYHLFERPQDVIANIYITRAHNDVVESWLETGVFGLALMGWFVVWFARRSLEIWRGGVPLQAEAIDWSLARSATIILPLLAAHCFFDYPLRTSAIMAVAAFACALLIEPPASAFVGRTEVARRTPAQEPHRVSSSNRLRFS